MEAVESGNIQTLMNNVVCVVTCQAPGTVTADCLQFC